MVDELTNRATSAHTVALSVVGVLTVAGIVVFVLLLTPLRAMIPAIARRRAKLSASVAPLPATGGSAASSGNPPLHPSEATGGAAGTGTLLVGASAAGKQSAAAQGAEVPPPSLSLPVAIQLVSSAACSPAGFRVPCAVTRTLALLPIYRLTFMTCP